MEKLDFGLLSELVIEELQTKAQEKNIEITLQKQDDLFMNGDQTLILRMMINLITNAINYGKIKDVYKRQVYNRAGGLWRRAEISNQ